MATESPHCEVCGLRAGSVFCCLSGEALGVLDEEKAFREYQRGQVLYYEGDPPFALYCIRSGQVKLCCTGNRAEQQILRLVGPGETIGYAAILENQPHATTAEAITATKACTVSRNTLTRLIRQSPDLALTLMARLAVELRAAERQLLSMSQESVKQRTANVLLMLSEGSGGESNIKSPIRRKEMAQIIGTTPETLSRVLNRFSEAGMVTRTRAEIRIRDPIALRKLARLPA
jgi:CRP-like cAMP-binding protein